MEDIAYTKEQVAGILLFHGLTQTYFDVWMRGRTIPIIDGKPMVYHSDLWRFVAYRGTKLPMD